MGAHERVSGTHPSRGHRAALQEADGMRKNVRELVCLETGTQWCCHHRRKWRGEPKCAQENHKPLARRYTGRWGTHERGGWNGNPHLQAAGDVVATVKEDRRRGRGLLMPDWVEERAFM